MKKIKGCEAKITQWYFPQLGVVFHACRGQVYCVLLNMPVNLWQTSKGLCSKVEPENKADR